MVAALVIILVLLLLFGGLGAFVAKAFLIGLAVVLVLSLLGGVLYWGRSH